MSDVFISHVEEDADVALALALGLEEAGFSTWCYELDSVAGVLHLSQTAVEIERASAVILVISAHSLGSNQVATEVVHAHESGKRFLPVLRDITYDRYQASKPEWRQAIGAATSLPIPAEGVAGIVARVAHGLRALGVRPRRRVDTGRVDRIGRRLADLAPGVTAISEVPHKPTLSQKARDAIRQWASRPVVRLVSVLGTAVAAAAIIVAVVALLSGRGGGNSHPAVLGSSVPVVGGPTGSPTSEGPGQDGTHTKPAQTSITPNADADVTRGIALSSADLGEEFDVRAEQTFAGDAEGFCEELKEGSDIDCSGYDLERNSFTTAFVRDLGGGSEPGLSHLVNYVIASASEADAYDIFKDLDTYNHLLCQWNGAEAYVVSDLSTSSVCDFTAPADVEFITGITSEGRFVGVVAFEGAPNPDHHRLVADALKKVAENMRRTR